MGNMDITGTGLSGLVGSKFVELFSNKYSIKNLDLTAGVDITKELDVMHAVEASSSPVVIHLAAFTDVNKAFEQTGDKDGVCYKVNVAGTQNIANACNKTGKHLIHVSTAFVFDGNKETMYKEDDTINPIEWYGVTKADAEEVVQKTCSSYTILRIDQPFRRDPFLKQDTAHKLIEQLKRGSFKPFEDHFFAPTIIEDFAGVINFCIENKPQGIFHATCGRKISDYEYASLINSALNLGAAVTPGKLEDYLKTVSRPYQKNTALDSSKLMSFAKDLVFTPLEVAISQLTV